MIDFDRGGRELAREHRPKLIQTGASGVLAHGSTTSRAFCARSPDEVDALLLFADIAHIAGLVAGGRASRRRRDRPHAVVATFTTHKTLRGPARPGCILCDRSRIAKRHRPRGLPRQTQGGPLEHVIAAKAVAFAEAATPAFADYAAGIVANARALAVALAAEGFRMVSGGTDNHLMLVDLRGFDAELTGAEAQTTLDRAGITLNKNTIPGDERSPFVTSGLRIGTAAVTTQGMGPEEMGQIASLIGRTLRHRSDDSTLAAVRREVRTLCGRFTPYP